MMMMSFSLTTKAMRAKSKTVTRRLGWGRLKPGTQLLAVEKAMGLKKGEKVVPIGRILVVDVRREQLQELVRDEHYGFVEVSKEGFPGMHPMAFITAYFPKVDPRQLITRVEFEHL